MKICYLAIWVFAASLQSPTGTPPSGSPNCTSLDNPNGTYCTLPRAQVRVRRRSGRCGGRVDMATPFVLRGRQQLPRGARPLPDHQYDSDLQLWIDQKSGKPVVLGLARDGVTGSAAAETEANNSEEGVGDPKRLGQSQFGETSFTKTLEGADTAEGIRMTPYGETIKTQVLAEGIDQPVLATDVDETDTDLSSNSTKEEAATFVPPYSHF